MAWCQTRRKQVYIHKLFLVISVTLTLNAAAPHEKAGGMDFGNELVYNGSSEIMNDEIVEMDSSYGECTGHWGQIHGYTYPVKNSRTVSCPRDGNINKIKYTFEEHEEGRRLHSISFTCSSSLGEMDAGTFGEKSDMFDEVDLICPEYNHISYILGKAGEFVNEFNIECTQSNIKQKSVHTIEQDARNVDNIKKVRETVKNHRGVKAVDIYDFTDACYATKGRRPVKFKIWADKIVNAIQVEYANVPVANSCELSHVELVDEEVNIEEDGFEVIGFTSGFTCSSLQQQINLDVYDSVSVGAEWVLGDSYNYMHHYTLPIGLDFGIAKKAKLIKSIAVEYGHNADNLKSRNHFIFLSTGKIDHALGTTIYYNGPGMALLVGFRVTYKMNNTNIPVLYHYTCAGGGSKPPEHGNINLEYQKLVGTVFFLDYQFTFNSTTECMSSSYPQECVASIQIKNYITHLEQLEKEFFKCLDPKAIKIPFTNY